MLVFVSSWEFEGSQSVSLQQYLLTISQLLCCFLLTLMSAVTSESIITHFYSLPARLLLEALVSVTPEGGEWAGNSSGDLGWLLYLSSIFNAPQPMLMTFDNRLISVHSVIFLWLIPLTPYRLLPSYTLMPRVTICSLFLESPNFKYSVLLPNQMSDHMLHIFFGGNMFTYLCLSSLNSAHQNLSWFC